MKSREQSSQLDAAFPIFSKLYESLLPKRILKGARIGWHCHLTELTAIAVETLAKLDVELFLSECNPNTTSNSAVATMRDCGAQIFLGDNSPTKVLSNNPELISDTGFVLTTEYLLKGGLNLIGGCEITTSGITAMRDMKKALTIPIINLNDGYLKSEIENFHGVGEGLVEALPLVSHLNWSGRHASVVGYGKVGQGCAHYLRTLGALVSITETNSRRALKAHYDGFRVDSLSNALKNSQLLVTATGTCGLLSKKEWLAAKDGLLIVNVGHFADELDLAALENLATEKTRHSEFLDEFALPSTETYSTSAKKIYIASNGHPLNVVLLTGSPEPTLIHLTTEVLALAYLIELDRSGKRLSSGEHSLPTEVEEQAATLALKALNL